MKNYFLLLSVTTACLVGCGEETKTYTVDYLLTDDDTRIQILADCEMNKQSDQNCKNANEAQNEINIKEYLNRRHSK